MLEIKTLIQFTSFNLPEPDRNQTGNGFLKRLDFFRKKVFINSSNMLFYS